MYHTLVTVYIMYVCATSLTLQGLRVKMLEHSVLWQLLWDCGFPVLPVRVACCTWCYTYVHACNCGTWRRAVPMPAKTTAKTRACICT
jgi:hypothetical protein